MKIVDIIPRQICVTIELSAEECASLSDFFEKAMLLYAKVYSDDQADDSLSVADDLTHQLKTVVKTIKEGD